LSSVLVGIFPSFPSSVSLTAFKTIIKDRTVKDHAKNLLRKSFDQVDVRNHQAMQIPIVENREDNRLFNFG
ncbi:MAG: hypothetical protein MUP68_02320, partial [Deltaproteobacteria bacterium]|nr:hypothetical protein [Deltaproteobacteria bacterium]